MDWWLLVVVALPVVVYFVRRVFFPAPLPWLEWAKQRIRQPAIPLRIRRSVGNTIASFIRVADLTKDLSPACQALVKGTEKKKKK